MRQEFTEAGLKPTELNRQLDQASQNPLYMEYSDKLWTQVLNCCVYNNVYRLKSQNSSRYYLMMPKELAEQILAGRNIPRDLIEVPSSINDPEGNYAQGIAKLEDGSIKVLEILLCNAVSVLIERDTAYECIKLCETPENVSATQTLAEEIMRLLENGSCSIEIEARKIVGVTIKEKKIETIPFPAPDA